MEAVALGVAWMVGAPCCLVLMMRPSTSVRVACVMTLVLLEAATIARTPVAAPELARHVAAPPGAGVAACAERTPVPARVRQVRAAGLVRSLAIFWKAAPGECATATVAMRRDGRRLMLWVQEGSGTPQAAFQAGHGHRELPVHVHGGTASVRLPLAPPLPARHRYLPVDGRTGRVIR